jgi:5-methylcytosine-specific restriction protein A
MTICSTPGCPNPVVKGRCPECQAELDRKRGKRRKDAESIDAEAGRATLDGKWRIIRAQYLKAHPDCEREGCTAAAVEVHHKVDRAAGGTHQWGNLEALCKSHHSQMKPVGINVFADPSGHHIAR